MAKDTQGGIGVRIVVAVTSLIGLGIVIWRLIGPLVSGVDAEHPGPIIIGGVVVMCVAIIAAWRWVTHRKSLSAKIRRRG